ncbi:MAG: DUF5107 domain-containing protein [Planctomycetota bacterium]
MTNSVLSARRSVLTIPTYTRFDARRLPIQFRNNWDNHYPATLDDILGGPKMTVDYDAIILENEHIRLTILPELGGKIWSVFNKNAGLDAVYVPDVIKPNLIALPGGWIAGGMEFNFPRGHHLNTMHSVPCAITVNRPDLVAASIDIVCPKTALAMRVIVSLAPNEARFRIRYEMSNPTPLAQRWYQWTNVGVLKTPKWQFMSKAKRYTTGVMVKDYPVDAKDGIDISWAVNRDFASDSFMIGLQEDFFGSYSHDQESGFAHIAPWKDLAGKKYFTWGHRYQEWDYDTLCDNGQDYLEIQTGPLPTQGDFEMMAPGAGRTMDCVWMPYHAIGGMDWADERLIFNVKDGQAALYPAVDQSVELIIDGQSHTRELKAGQPEILPVSVRVGAQVEIKINGESARVFNYPLEGRQAPNLDELTAKYSQIMKTPAPETAEQFLEKARRSRLHNAWDGAVKAYEKTLEINPNQDDARLEYADALAHIADFAGARRELKALSSGARAEDARLGLVRVRLAEDRFMAPVLAIPDGITRDLAYAERLAGNYAAEPARALFQKVLKADKHNARAHYAMACYYHQDHRDPRKAVIHAVAALDATTTDDEFYRDYLLELTPILQNAGEHQRALAYLDAAPRTIRNIPIFDRIAIRSLLEVERLDDCWRILSRKRMYNWEGENEHVQIFRDCALMEAETALLAGVPSLAKQWVERSRELPKGLGVRMKLNGEIQLAFWDGLFAKIDGDAERAKAVWTAGVTAILDTIRLKSNTVVGPNWVYWMSPEIAYAFGLCGLCCGDPAIKDEVFARLDERITNSKTFNVWVPAYTEYGMGIIAELKGDFAEATRLFKVVVKTSGTNIALAKRNLQALKTGRRRLVLWDE